jgi:OOP family OmpA-OmpF porin
MLIKPASKKFVYVPATYKTVTKQVRVEDVYNEVSIKPAAFSPGTEEIVAQPAYASFEYQRAMENCNSDDPRDCLVLCYVENAEQKRIVAIETLDNDASFTSTEKGGEVITITYEEEVTPARVDEVEIPAEYRTIEKRVLVKDETVNEVTVEAEYRTEIVRELKEKGGIAVWEEIDCKLTGANVLPIFYELGSARLTSESRKIIDDKLLALMKEKSNIKIELSSHTDSRGSATSNLDLSQRRAQSVVNYLASKGISRSRLIAQGYGETRLVNRCKDGVQCSETEHQQNRRTEFRVISE